MSSRAEPEEPSYRPRAHRGWVKKIAVLSALASPLLTVLPLQIGPLLLEPAEANQLTFATLLVTLVCFFGAVLYVAKDRVPPKN